MHYHISKIAHIVGISSEAIRLYEKKGILSANKNEENGYRSYGTLDIGTILRCRSYAQYGFSLSEAAELINDCDLSATHKLLVGQEAYLEREIDRYQRMLLRLRELNDLIDQIKERPDTVGACTLVLHPGIYRMDYHHNGILSSDPEILKLFSEWSGMVPLSFVSLRLPLESLRQQRQDYDVGMGVLEKDAAFLDIRESGPVKYYPSCLAVQCILAVPGDGPVEVAQLSSLLAYTDRHGLTPISDAFSRMVLAIHRNKTDFVRYYQIWLPVK